MSPSRSSTTRMRCSRSSARTRQRRQSPAAACASRSWATSGGSSSSQTSCEWLCARLAPAAAPSLTSAWTYGKPGLARGGRACLPGLGDELELAAAEVGDRADVPGRVDDDLLPADGRPAGEEALRAVAVARPGPERRELVRDDADAPAGGVRRPPGRAERERLGRRRGLPPLAERAAGRVVLLVVGEPALRARAARSRRRDHDPPARDRIVAELRGRVTLRQPVSPVPLPRKGPSRSIGSGRISVDERSELISSIVCR